MALALVLALLAPGQAPAADLLDAVDLRRLAAELRDRPRPIMLEFAAAHCSYCDLLEGEILRPMLLNPDSRRRVVIRRLDLDSHKLLTDFHGRRVTPGQLAERYAVDLTPTLVFVDGRGEEIAPRLVGVYSLDYYGGIVDQRIELGQGRLDGTERP